MIVQSDIICGIDEAGRGALAGPLTAAAVILPCRGAAVAARAGVPLRDGKLLSPLQRQKIYTALTELHAVMSIEYISVRSINTHGIGWANREAMRRLVRRMTAGRYILDGKLNIGRVNGKTPQIFSVVDADATIDEVICAGIVAKVQRDTLMHTLHKRYPPYAWEQNAGYGTKRHIEAIRQFGVCRYHRNIFVATALANYGSHSLTRTV